MAILRSMSSSVSPCLRPAEAREDDEGEDGPRP